MAKVKPTHYIRQKKNVSRQVINKAGITNRVLPLNGLSLARLLGFAAVGAAFVQLPLGASPPVVFLALVGSAFGLLGFAILGAYNLASWVSLFYVLGNVLVALYAKTVFLEPIDSRLYAPMPSFASIAVTCFALTAALVLVNNLKVGRPILPPIRDHRLLFALSWGCFGLGLVFWLVNRLSQDPGGSGFGGVAVLRHLLIMAVIARTAALLEQSLNRRSFDAQLGWIIACSASVGFLDNTKTAAALPVVGHFATILFYRRGIPIRAIAILAIGAALFVLVVTPVIHGLRAMGQKQLPLGERAEFVISNFQSLLSNPEYFIQLEQLAAGQFNRIHYNYFGDHGSQMILGRYASVQQVDPVIAEVNRLRPLGGEAVWPALGRLVPSFIYPDKPQYTEAFNTLVYYDLVNPDGGKFPTLPLAGQTYAAYGVPGLLIIPFVTFFVFFLVLKKLGWQLHRNIYAIFFFCSFVVVYVNQGSFGQYMGASLRNFPLLAVAFLLIVRFCKILLQPIKHRRYPAAVEHKAIGIKRLWPTKPTAPASTLATSSPESRRWRRRPWPD